jgi:hypothetical protein
MGWTREQILAVRPVAMVETPAERMARLCEGVRFGKVPMSAAPQMVTWLFR